MANSTYFGLHIPVGSDIASSALTDPTNQNILDAAAGHVWSVATGTNAEIAWFTVNAVSPTATTATMKVATPAAALSLNAAGLLQLFITPTGTAGGVITWGPAVFVVSPTGAGTAIVSASTWNLSTVSSTSVNANVLLVTPTVSATSAYVQLGQPNPLTTATSAFAYLASMVSTPTATPTTLSGMSPMVVDITTPALWFAPNTGTGAAWKSIGVIVGTVTALTSGSGTYTTPANTKLLWVRAVGGGGGASGTQACPAIASSPGGGGGYSEWWTTTPAATYSYAVGAAGTLGGPSATGGAGGNTTFGGVTANGGAGGPFNSSNAGGGGASGGTVNIGGNSAAGGPGSTGVGAGVLGSVGRGGFQTGGSAGLLMVVAF